MTNPMPAVAQPARGKKIKELEVMVSDVIQETPDTATLVFFTGNDHLEYKAGHFLTIDPHQFEALARFTAFLEDVKQKKELPRAYSLSSAPYEKNVAITVKEETYVSGQTKYPPLLSPLLVRRTPRGTRMVVTGFTGPYVLPEDVESKTEHLVHVVAGSGAVPNYAIIKDTLHHGRKLRHTLIYANKTYSDICFREPLLDLQRQYPDRLKVIHTLTREQDRSRFTETIRQGRISSDLLKELIPEPQTSLVYLCGPAISPWDRKLAVEKGEKPAPRFLESSIELLREHGVPDQSIKRESWG